MLNLSDEEIDNQLSKLSKDLLVSFTTKNIVQINYTFQVLWNYTYNRMLVKTTKKRNEIILPVLFDIITTYPLLIPKIQSKSATLFCELLRNPKFRPDNLHFSIQKVLYMHKMLFSQKGRLFTLKISNFSEYYNFFMQVRYFFNEDDAKYLIKKYFYRLGNPDALSLQSLTIICIFFPPKYFKMIIDDLLILLQNVTTETHSNAIISFICECIKYENLQYSQNVTSKNNDQNFEKFNWSSYFNIFFNYALISLNPKVSINGIDFSANSQIHSMTISGITDFFDISSINYLSKLIIILIVDGEQGDEALKYFKKFINILAPLFFTSSNLASSNQVKRGSTGEANNYFIISNNNEIEFALFIQIIISDFYQNNKKVLRKKSKKKLTHACANLAQIKEFVRIVLPIIQTAIFRANQCIQKFITESIRFLAELDFPQVGQLLLEQSVDNIDDDENSHFSLSCKEIILQLIPSIMTDERILGDSKDFIPKIIYSAVECLSNVNENIYYIGLSILGSICHFFEATDEKSDLSDDDIQKVESGQKVIIQCLENTFDQFIEYTINHEEHSNDLNDVTSKDIQKKPFYFNLYFLSFEDSFLQSKVPYLIDTIDQGMDKKSIPYLLYQLFDSRPFLFEFITPKIFDRLDKAINDKDKKKKKYYSLILSKLSSFSPYFIPFMDGFKKRIDLLIDECSYNSFKCVFCLFSYIESFILFKSYCLVRSESSCQKLKNTKGVILNDTEKVSQKKWEWLGKQIDGLKIVSYKLTDDFVIEQIEYLIQTLEKLEKKLFEVEEESKNGKNNFKIYKKILSVIQLFVHIFECKGQVLQSEAKSYRNLTENTPGVTKIDLQIKRIELIIRNLIIKGITKHKDNENSQKLLLMIQLANLYFFKSHGKVLIHTIFLNALQSFRYQFRNECKKPLIYQLDKKFSVMSLTKYMYLAEYDEEVVNLIYEVSHTMNHSIFDLSINIISFFGQVYKNVYHDIALKELEVLENKKYVPKSVNSESLETSIDQANVLTEEQCITAIVILAVTCSSQFLYENEYLTRLLKSIVNLKFDKNWNISKYLLGFYKSISFMKEHFEVKDDQIWRDFTSSIIPTMKASNIDGQNETNPNWWMTKNEFFWWKLIDLVSFQKPPVSSKFFLFLLNTCLNLYEPHRIDCLICLSNLFARMKPHTKKVQVEEIPPNCIYDNRCSLYFKKKGELRPIFTIYEGFSEFDNSDGYQRLRGILFDFFTTEKITHLIDSIALSLNEKSASNEDNNGSISDSLLELFECFWKGLAIIMKGQTVPLIKDKLTDIAMNKSGPLLSVLFSIVSGVWKASKHWNEEDKKMLNNELIIPILRIIFFKRNSTDAFQMLSATAASFSARRDPKRLTLIFDFVMKSIADISAKHQDDISSENDNTLSYMINFASSLLINIYYGGYADLFVSYINDYVLPSFGADFDFDNFTLLSVSSLAKFCTSLTSTNLISERGKSEIECLPNWASIPFEKVFDPQFKKKRYDKLAVFLIELISPACLELKSFIPFISARIEQIFIVLSNLSTKFQSLGPQMILQVGLLHWEKYPDLLHKSVLPKIKDVIIPSLTVVQHGWWIKCSIVTFLHVLCVRNLFILPIETYKIIMKEILPLLINEKSENVRESSMDLLIFLVNVIYCGQFDVLSQECLQILKNKDDALGREFATATACAMLYNMSLMNCCPEWLPKIFNELENIYFRGTSFKNVIQKSVKDFWVRHGVHEIPELDEYRFSFSESYYA